MITKSYSAKVVLNSVLTERPRYDDDVTHRSFRFISRFSFPLYADRSGKMRACSQRFQAMASSCAPAILYGRRTDNIS